MFVGPSRSATGRFKSTRTIPKEDSAAEKNRKTDRVRNFADIARKAVQAENSSNSQQTVQAGPAAQSTADRLSSPSSVLSSSADLPGELQNLVAVLSQQLREDMRAVLQTHLGANSGGIHFCANGGGEDIGLGPQDVVGRVPHLSEETDPVFHLAHAYTVVNKAIEKQKPVGDELGLDSIEGHHRRPSKESSGRNRVDSQGDTSASSIEKDHNHHSNYHHHSGETQLPPPRQSPLHRRTTRFVTNPIPEVRHSSREVEFSKATPTPEEEPLVFGEHDSLLNVMNYTNSPLVRGFLGDNSEAFERQMSGPEREAERRFYKEFLRQHGSDSIIGFFVLLNCALVGLQTEYMSRMNSWTLPANYMVLDVVFCGIFLLELLIKLICYRKEFLFGSEWSWNLFDCVLVGTQMLDIVAHWCARPDVDDTSNLSFLRCLRILRMLRIARIIRAFRFIEELRTIASCVLSSMRSLIWSVIFIFFTVYTAAIVFANIVLDTRLDLAREGIAISDELEYWYGDLGRTTLTMFEAIASGVSWDDALKPLISNISPSVGIIFVCYILFSMVAMMNVITGVFVDAMMNNADKSNKEAMANHLSEVFACVDIDGSGTITWEEFESRLHRAELQEYFEQIDVDITEAEGLFQLIDSDDSGSVDSCEFVSACVRLRGPAKALELALLMHDCRRMHNWTKHHIEEIHDLLKLALAPGLWNAE